MSIHVPRNSRLRNDLGENAVRFLEHGLGGIMRLLPHVEVAEWSTGDFEETNVVWSSSERKALGFVLGIDAGRRHSIKGRIERLKVPRGVGAISRTIDLRERSVCEGIIRELGNILSHIDHLDDTSLNAISATFDERVVSVHLKSYHSFAAEPRRLFEQLRGLAGQTYENRALTFGCIVVRSTGRPGDMQPRFPEDFLTAKRFRALSDGYRTAYVVSDVGEVTGFVDLQKYKPTHGGYFPEWCRDLARASTESRIGVALTRTGDIVVLDDGNLRFTYRAGRWQYWNHSHLVDLLRNAGRVQNVPPSLVSKVVRSIYRAALDVSFRRSGALFVLLRNRRNLHQLVRKGDAIGDGRRPLLDRAFDQVAEGEHIQNLPRTVLTELASVDGAVVVSNQGELLAYGAVLDPHKKGRIRLAEGSRTKAAIGASKLGMAVKVSADGDITVFVGGNQFITV